MSNKIAAPYSKVEEPKVTNIRKESVTTLVLKLQAHNIDHDYAVSLAKIRDYSQFSKPVTIVKTVTTQETEIEN